MERRAVTALELGGHQLPGAAPGAVDAENDANPSGSGKRIRNDREIRRGIRNRRGGVPFPDLRRERVPIERYRVRLVGKRRRDRRPDADIVERPADRIEAGGRQRRAFRMVVDYRRDAETQHRKGVELGARVDLSRRHGRAGGDDVKHVDVERVLFDRPLEDRRVGMAVGVYETRDDDASRRAHGFDRFSRGGPPDAGHSRSHDSPVAKPDFSAVVNGHAVVEGENRSARKTEKRRRHAASNSTSCAPSQSVSLPSAGRFSSPDVSVMKWLPASWPIFDAK